MCESTQTQSFQVEDLLHHFGAALAAKREQDMPVRKPAGVDGRSLLAGFLAVFVFAPGCAAATVFLMNAEDRLSPITMQDGRSPSVSKANRLPLSQWKAKAAVSVATAPPALIAEDSSFLGPLAIRGRLDEEIIAAAMVAEVAAPAEGTVVSPRPKRKQEARRARPVTVVAEAAVPEPEPPSLFEKLFAPRNL